ncbi:MAG: LytTR family transcriptional regulator DNA-binding domain-containing protein [Spirosoma sp.]|nr:LytTR family transcriptional regulator DNA-binding domain-containing protein [Spirosoma sp.]
MLLHVPILIRIRSGRIRHEFTPDQIVQVQSVGNYSMFCLTDGRQLLSCRTLKLYQDMLPAYFIRVHRRCLVNGYFVAQRIDTDRLLLHTGEEVPLSRRSIGHYRRCTNRLHSQPRPALAYL